MSRDKSTTTEPTTKPTLASMFEMLNDLEDDTVITGLPPTTASFVRTPRPDTPIADLTRLAKVWMLIGPGASGKTVLARWLGGELHVHDKLDRTLLAALDPANRTLADFFSAVMQPPTSNPAETVGLAAKSAGVPDQTPRQCRARFWRRGRIPGSVGREDADAGRGDGRTGHRLDRRLHADPAGR